MRIETGKTIEQISVKREWRKRKKMICEWEIGNVNEIRNLFLSLRSHFMFLCECHVNDSYEQSLSKSSWLRSQLKKEEHKHACFWPFVFYFDFHLTKCLHSLHKCGFRKIVRRLKFSISRLMHSTYDTTYWIFIFTRTLWRSLISTHFSVKIKANFLLSAPHLTIHTRKPKLNTKLEYLGIKA